MFIIHMSTICIHIVCPHVFPKNQGRPTQHRGFTGIYGVECAHHCRTRVFGRNYIQTPSMTRKTEREFVRLGNCPINRQVSLLEEATDLVFNVENSEMANLIEMALVRHLCLHNRSEIDETYLQKTSLRSGDEGELRIVEVEELLSWQRSFISVINKTWRPIAMKYVKAPKYP